MTAWKLLVCQGEGAAYHLKNPRHHLCDDNSHSHFLFTWLTDKHKARHALKKLQLNKSSFSGERKKYQINFSELCWTAESQLLYLQDWGSQITSAWRSETEEEVYMCRIRDQLGIPGHLTFMLWTAALNISHRGVNKSINSCISFHWILRKSLQDTFM